MSHAADTGAIDDSILSSASIWHVCHGARVLVTPSGHWVNVLYVRLQSAIVCSSMSSRDFCFTDKHTNIHTHIHTNKQTYKRT